MLDAAHTGADRVAAGPHGPGHDPEGETSFTQAIGDGTATLDGDVQVLITLRALLDEPDRDVPVVPP